MIAKVLEEAGKGTVAKLRQSFDRGGVNASGTLSRTLQYDVQDGELLFGLQVTAEGYVFEVEEGTPPPGKGGSRALVPDIEKWINDKRLPLFKGFRDKKAMAYAITRKINKEGTRRFRTHSNSGILSDVLNDSLIDDINEGVLREYAEGVLEGIVKAARE